MFAISVGGQKAWAATPTDEQTELWEIVQVKYAILVWRRGLTCPLSLRLLLLILLKFPGPTKSLLSAPHCQEVEDGAPEGT